MEPFSPVVTSPKPLASAIAPPPTVLEVSSFSTVNPYRIPERKLEPNPRVSNFVSPVSVSCSDTVLSSSEGLTNDNEKELPNKKYVVTSEDLEAVKKLMIARQKGAKF